jgi:hypothetical protein
MYIVVREVMSEMTLHSRPVVGPTAATHTDLLILILSHTTRMYMACCFTTGAQVSCLEAQLQQADEALQAAEAVCLLIAALSH